MAVTYSIRALAASTGISAHTIRAWERRYTALTPDRTQTNRRVYSEDDRVRLEILGKLVAAGHSIGRLAHLSDADLGQMVQGLRPVASVAENGEWLSNCTHAIWRLDESGLDRAINRATGELGLPGLLRSVVVPLMAWLDEGWSSGHLNIAHEHIATAVLRTRLEQSRLGLRAEGGAARVLVTTPTRQMHEIGALIVALTAALRGWNVLISARACRRAKSPRRPLESGLTPLP